MRYTSSSTNISSLQTQKHNQYAKYKTKDLLLRLIYSICAFFVFWLFASLIFALEEDWNYFRSLYFSAITTTTVGFADTTPDNDVGRIFVSFYAVVSVGLLIYTLTNAMALYSDNARTMAKLNMKQENYDTGNLFLRFIGDTNEALAAGKILNVKFNRATIKLFYILALFFLNFLILASLVQITERWSVFNSLYFASVTITTIGWNTELSPHSDLIRFYVVVFLFIFEILKVYALCIITDRGINERIVQKNMIKNSSFADLQTLSQQTEIPEFSIKQLSEVSSSETRSRFLTNLRKLWTSNLVFRNFVYTVLISFSFFFIGTLLFLIVEKLSISDVFYFFDGNNNKYWLGKS